MLKNNHRKILLEHDLLYFLSKDSNPHQQWQRTKNKCLLALRDLTLIASKSSNEKLHEIFNETTLKDLLNYIFRFNRLEKEGDTRISDVKLASFLARTGIDICIYEYQKWNRDTPETSKPAIDHLNRAIAICDEIGYKATLNLMESESRRKNLKYICIWEEIDSKDRDKFDNYIIKDVEVKEDSSMYPIQVIPKKKTLNEKEIYIFQSDIPLEDNYDESYVHAIFLGSVRIIINKDQDKGKIIFYNRENNETKSEDLILKKYGSQTAIFSK